MAALRQATSDGYLTLLEFEERLDAAFAARYLDELDVLLADLPGARRVGTPRNSHPPRAPRARSTSRTATWPAGLPRLVVRSVLTVLAVMLALTLIANFWIPMLIFGLVWMKRGRGRCGWAPGRCWSGGHRHRLDYI